MTEYKKGLPRFFTGYRDGIIPEDRIELRFPGNNMFVPAFKVAKHHIDEWPSEYAAFKRSQSWSIKAKMLISRLREKTIITALYWGWHLSGKPIARFHKETECRRSYKAPPKEDDASFREGIRQELEAAFTKIAGSKEVNTNQGR